MNEKSNPWIISTIILVIIGIILGFRSRNDSGTIQQLENNNREIRKEVRGLKFGIGIITGISEGYRKNNQKLRNTITGLERDKEQYRTELDATYRELKNTTGQLRILEQQLKKRDNKAIAAGEEIGREIKNLREIITEVENGQND